MPVHRLRGSTRSRARSQRAPTSWARTPNSAGLHTTIALGTATLLATIELSNAGIGETVRRTRGMLMVTSDQGSTFETQVGLFGMVVVSDPAAGVGITAVPTPGSEASDDGWFVWEPFMGAGAGVNGNSLIVKEFDSKAMRRIEEGFQIAVVAENMSSSFGLELSFAFSILTSIS